MRTQDIGCHHTKFSRHSDLAPRVYAPCSVSSFWFSDSTSCAVFMKSGNLNFLEPSGPLRACNGTALPLPFTIYVRQCVASFNVGTVENKRVQILNLHNLPI